MAGAVAGILDYGCQLLEVGQAPIGLASVTRHLSKLQSILPSLVRCAAGAGGAVPGLALAAALPLKSGGLIRYRAIAVVGETAGRGSGWDRVVLAHLGCPTGGHGQTQQGDGEGVLQASHGKLLDSARLVVGTRDCTKEGPTGSCTIVTRRLPPSYLDARVAPRRDREVGTKPLVQADERGVQMLRG